VRRFGRCGGCRASLDWTAEGGCRYASTRDELSGLDACDGVVLTLQAAAELCSAWTGEAPVPTLTLV